MGTQIHSSKAKGVWTEKIGWNCNRKNKLLVGTISHWQWQKKVNPVDPLSPKVNVGGSNAAHGCHVTKVMVVAFTLLIGLSWPLQQFGLFGNR